MKIKRIHLTNFKRFTDTTIGDIPPEVKLILLAGPNGSGKSSLIDAAHYYHRQVMSGIGGFDQTYHVKQLGGVNPSWTELVNVEFHGEPPQSPQDKRKAVYVRSAYRNEAEFQISSLSRVGPAIDSPRFNRLIDNDQSVSQNYHRLVSRGIEDLYNPEKGSTTFKGYVDDSVGELRDSLKRLFPDLTLNSLSNPLSQGTFRFSKGDSSDFLYKNLSGGEKSVFDLLLDIYVNRDEYNNSVFFIDEPEAHVGFSVHGPLLSELYNIIPENGQLWLATHSIGMMRRARDISHQHPGTVAFLDFEGVNFDLPVTLAPVEPDRPFWRRAMQIALDDIAGYVAPDAIVLCEGGGVAEGAAFDSECYNEIFKTDFPHVVFLGAGNSDDVQRDPKGVGRLLSALTPSVKLVRLLDRDDRTDEEIKISKEKGIHVLTLRMIETYLLDDEILTLLCAKLGNPDSAKELIGAKERAIENSVANGGAPDDFKRIAGDVYTAAKRLFPTLKLGGDKRSFMKGMCVPLVTKETSIYKLLRDDIFGS